MRADFENQPIQELKDKQQNKQNILNLANTKWVKAKKNNNIFELQRYSQLQLNNNLHRTIIQEIIINPLHQLQRLYLKNNQIQNIQLIQHLYAPKLLSIQLTDNHIVQIKAFRKLQAPQLYWLRIFSNKIKNFDCISELHARNLKSLGVQLPMTPIQCQQLDWTIKLMTLTDFQLKIQTQNPRRVKKMNF